MADALSATLGMASLSSAVVVLKELHCLLEGLPGSIQLSPPALYGPRELSAFQSIIETDKQPRDMLMKGLRELSTVTERALGDNTFRGLSAAMKAVATKVEDMKLQLCEYEASKHSSGDSMVMIPSKLLPHDLTLESWTQITTSFPRLSDTSSGIFVLVYLTWGLTTWALYRRNIKHAYQNPAVMTGVIGSLLIAILNRSQDRKLDALMALTPLCVSLAMVLSAIIHALRPELQRNRSTDVVCAANCVQGRRLKEHSQLSTQC